MGPSRSKLHRALVDLSRQTLENKAAFDILDRYRTGNPHAKYDRSLALITGSFIEQGLESVIALATVVEYDQPGLRTELFGGDKPGALNGFYGKIILGHALGAYPLTFKQDLDRIRHIRNTFAHAKGEISFKTPEVAEACHFYTTEHFSGGEKPITLTTPRNRYVFMAFFAILTFELEVKQLEKMGRPSPYGPDAVLP